MPLKLYDLSYFPAGCERFGAHDDNGKACWKLEKRSSSEERRVLGLECWIYKGQFEDTDVSYVVGFALRTLNCNCSQLIGLHAFVWQGVSITVSYIFRIPFQPFLGLPLHYTVVRLLIGFYTSHTLVTRQNG
jgi:hypothetical protein